MLHARLPFGGGNFYNTGRSVRPPQGCGRLLLPFRIAIIGPSPHKNGAGFTTRIMPMKKPATATKQDLASRRNAPLATPTDLKAAATRDITGAMNAILADVFALYLKTKNFHWHMSGPHFRDYHLLLDEQADQIYAMTDPIAERIRKLGGSTLRSIGHIARTQRLSDNDAEYVEPLDMLAELREDNKTLVSELRVTHDLCDEHRDIASASLIEVWIDETERRTWFLFEASRRGDATGH
jgi:starvation-inducible DNA-binding protein